MKFVGLQSGTNDTSNQLIDITNPMPAGIGKETSSAQADWGPQLDIGAA